MYHTSRSFAVILFLVFHANAQISYNSNQQNPFHPSHPSLAISIGVISILLSVTFFLLAYGKFIVGAFYGVFTNVEEEEEEIPLGILQPGSRFSGIERRVVESLPFFKFSTLKGPKEGLECAICLSEFHETETLRLMPKCKHAFHMECIDKWFEDHSSCPICRDRFVADDLRNFPCTNSLRYFPCSLNQTEQQNVQFFVEREQERIQEFRDTVAPEREEHSGHNRRSSWYNMMMGSVRRLANGWREEQLLLQKGCDFTTTNHGNHLHKFKHRIIVSDLICKSRWSDLNSSDLTFLNSEMLNYLSSKRFSHTKSQSFHGEFRMNEDIIKIKDDFERKRIFESRVSKISTDSATSSFVQDQRATNANLLNPAEKRAMSEIVYLPRGANINPRLRNMEPLSTNERIRGLWLPIARRTLQWFNGRESVLEFKKSPINVV